MAAGQRFRSLGQLSERLITRRGSRSRTLLLSCFGMVGPGHSFIRLPTATTTRTHDAIFASLVIKMNGIQVMKVIVKLTKDIHIYAYVCESFLFVASSHLPQQYTDVHSSSRASHQTQHSVPWTVFVQVSRETPPINLQLHEVAAYRWIPLSFFLELRPPDLAGKSPRQRFVVCAVLDDFALPCIMMGQTQTRGRL